MRSWEPARRVLDEGLASAVYPGAVVEVGSPAGPLWRYAAGRLTYAPGAPPAAHDTIYDLASLTKVLATTPVALLAAIEGRLDLAARVAERLPAWTGADRAGVTVSDLLEHCSGLPAWAPLYESGRGRTVFERRIAASPLAYAPRTSSTYSDLGFILLGFLLEDAEGARLDALAERAWEAMGRDRFDDLWFMPPPGVHARIAPARSAESGGARPPGVVDDDNAAALDGVAGHAGLFGTAGAVGACAAAILRALAGGATSVLRRMMDEALVRSTAPGSTRARGWDLMAATSSCGTRLSPRAFGHTGFTGTSLWIDPAIDTYIVLLSNRVHPEPGSPDGIQRVRRTLHDAVASIIGGARG